MGTCSSAYNPFGWVPKDGRNDNQLVASCSAPCESFTCEPRFEEGFNLLLLGTHHVTLQENCWSKAPLRRVEQNKDILRLSFVTLTISSHPLVTKGKWSFKDHVSSNKLLNTSNCCPWYAYCKRRNTPTQRDCVT